MLQLYEVRLPLRAILIQLGYSRPVVGELHAILVIAGKHYFRENKLIHNLYNIQFFVPASNYPRLV